MIRYFLRYLCLLALLAWASSSVAQSCACAREFDFTVRYLETNLPGFARNVPPAKRPAYAAFKQSIRRLTTTNPPKITCLKYLMTYVEYFRDSHTTISTGAEAVDEGNPAAVARFRASPEFTSAETLALPDTARPRAPGALEGYYQSADGTYRVYLTRSKTAFRNYAAVLVAARTKLWRPGQVKFELRRTTDSTFQAYLYQRNHSLAFVPAVRYRRGHLLGLGWHKVSGSAPLPEPPCRRVDFRLLADSQVAYLRIPSFAGEQFTRLDSLYRAVTPRIQRTQYLVIDVRDNGGGADRNVAPLLAYLYAQPIREIQTEEYYVTADNLRRYEEYLRQMLADSAGYGATAIWSFREKLAWLKKQPLNTFVLNPHSADKTYTLTPSPLPAKVAVLYNRGCASACETLLFWAQQPSKALLVGENSGGYVGYGNVLPVKTPCYGFTLEVTTMQFANQVAYEEIGVAPQYRLRDDQDWLEQTIRILRQTDTSP
ncbi:hypothetical protein LGH70_08060 [Hymenobacter sp. BT635]|uniref:Tail specific protease domain-containing protein n=1 Tax=Hymenobacter nitidus TaxID=2880929 RepID=A0ABS8ACT7_9BACT|nr:S41 family peptidase [Hymenobacter nitidus]MCB2377532.1 hypothetical protein [Hymenobacter nitidus]